MSLSHVINIDYTPTLIPVDINFCEFTSGEGESICSIQESEKSSRNKIFFDHKGENPKILIDKRSVTSEKAQYVFQKELITIGKQSVINMPYLRKSLLIRAGEYKVEVCNQGYIISLTNG
tara:strand:+ start:83 stop:442 length:360 start_codon:yes stop_codon:yes gene_type:complete